MNDLLPNSLELLRSQGSRGGDIKMGFTNYVEEDNGLDEFKKEIDDVESEIENLNFLLKTLQGVNEESKSVTRPIAMKVIRERMQKGMNEVGKIALSVKTKIEEINLENLDNRRKPGCEAGTAIDRIREQETLTVKRKLKNKMSEFHTLRNNIHQEYREVVRRSIFTVTGESADEEKVDTLIENGDSERIFQREIHQEPGRGHTLGTMLEIQERDVAVRELEKKLLELQQVFSDMAVLVEAQGEMLNNIEAHVTDALDYVVQGNRELQKSKKLKRNKRKWMCVGIMILLIMVAVIAVAVFQPWEYI
ncbi:hypothetical protein ACHQM5_004509 [Ranunculus cassubicifolius]